MEPFEFFLKYYLLLSSVGFRLNEPNLFTRHHELNFDPLKQKESVALQQMF